MKNIIPNDELLKKGYVDLKIDSDIDIKSEIISLRKNKNAVILAHYYQEAVIQDIADFVGDSLGLSQQAAKTKAEIIVFCGVHFMAETAKILCPDKKVLLPDLNAGCSLAESCKEEDFKNFKKKYPGHTVVSYVNTSAAIKAMSDIICTSSNAVKIIESLPEKEKIIFTPDRNLGNYIASLTGRKMVVWNGACHVHEAFSLEKILYIKKIHPDAKILVHPECENPVRLVADYIGSTASMLKYSYEDKGCTYIVATEPGILHQMRIRSPQKKFIPAPPIDSTCGCSDCRFMKLITLEKLYNCLTYEIPEVKVSEDVRKKAERPLKRMLEISKNL